MDLSESTAPATQFSERQPEQENDALKVQPARGSVLVVEDDPSNRELLVEVLSMWGYEPVPVGSAEEAEYVTRRKPLFAAVVDVFLPGRSGTALMAKLREQFPQAILIGMSALSDATMARRCKGIGADLFIGKPLNPEQLARALKSHHRSWH